MNEKEKIKKFLEYKGLSKNKFYTNTGLSTGFLDKGKSLGADKVKIIINAFPELSIDWLILNKGNMIENSDELKKNAQLNKDGKVIGKVKKNTLLNTHLNKKPPNYPATTSEPSIRTEGIIEKEARPISVLYKKVPRVPVHAQAGFLNGYGDEAYMAELPTELWEVDKEYKGHYVVFEVRGDSMDDNSANAILDGDRILCREIQRHHWQNKLHIKKWNFVIAHKEEGIIVKRIIDHDVEKAMIVCHSLNTYYDDFKIVLDNVIALYNVVDMKRTLRI